MYEYLSSFERRLQTKHWVVIDSSIILAAGVPSFKPQDYCVKYLAKANKMYHPCITKPIMGELLKALCQVTDINLAMSAFQFVRDLTNEFKHIPHMHLEESDLEFLAKNFSGIPMMIDYILPILFKLIKNGTEIMEHLLVLDLQQLILE